MKILRPTPQDYDELLTVWEASVRSTHHFLTEENIQFYKPLVRNQYFQAVELYIIRNREGKIAAFMGLSDELIEMLFVHPEEQGKGYGKQLIEFAIHNRRIFKGEDKYSISLPYIYSIPFLAILIRKSLKFFCIKGLVM